MPVQSPVTHRYKRTELSCWLARQLVVLRSLTLALLVSLLAFVVLTSNAIAFDHTDQNRVGVGSTHGSQRLNQRRFDPQSDVYRFTPMAI